MARRKSTTPVRRGELQTAFVYGASPARARESALGFIDKGYNVVDTYRNEEGDTRDEPNKRFVVLLEKNGRPNLRQLKSVKRPPKELVGESEADTN